MMEDVDQTDHAGGSRRSDVGGSRPVGGGCRRKSTSRRRMSEEVDQSEAYVGGKRRMSEEVDQSEAYVGGRRRMSEGVDQSEAYVGGSRPVGDWISEEVDDRYEHLIYEEFVFVSMRGGRFGR